MRKTIFADDSVIATTTKWRISALTKIDFWFSPQVTYPDGIFQRRKLGHEYLTHGTFKAVTFFEVTQGLFLLGIVLEFHRSY
jgi:hypothetical protein